METFRLAQDQYYLSDLNEDGLSNLYHLVHNEYLQKSDRTNPKQLLVFEVEALKAEVVMIREFQMRKTLPPKLDDPLTKRFNELYNRIRKVNGKLYEATTQTDLYDQHVHHISNMTDTGDGSTEEAGNPPHTHNVVGFMVSPIEMDQYKSDHPGKVDVRVSKSGFEVVKRLEDGGLEWKARFDLIKKDEDQQLVAGIVYEPDIMDAQGDSASEEEIRKACHNFMMKSMTQGLMHEKRLSKQDTAIVENFIAPISYMEGGQLVHKGSWVMVSKVLNKDLWKGIKEGKYTGYSMGGKARDMNRTMKRDTVVPELTVSNFQKYSLLLKTDLEKVIRQVGRQYCVFTHDGGKKIACHDTRDEAFRHLAAIEANKHLTPKHVSEPVEKAEDYVITADHMKQICTKCALLMKKKKITKVKLGTIVNKAKFKRVFGIRRSSLGHNGLCKQFSNDMKLFKDAITGKKGAK